MREGGAGLGLRFNSEPRDLCVRAGLSPSHDCFANSTHLLFSSLNSKSCAILVAQAGVALGLDESG